MTRTVADTALLLEVLAGPDAHDPLTGRAGQFDHRSVKPPEAFRVGRLAGPFFTEVTDAEVGAALDRAAALLAQRGGRIGEVRLSAVEAAQAAQTTILFAEAAAYHQRAYPGRLAEYGPDLRELLAEGATLPATAYVEAQRVQAVVIREVRALLEDVDVLLCPTVPVPAPRIDDVDPARTDGWRQARAPLSRFTRLFNLTGLPAISVPVGRTRTGLPIGAQLAAAPRQEARLLSIAAALETAVGWEPVPLPA
jgi:aspartyl-tRNA(Asn)/glutamyl-tRNA(Gln) amidotransferase subunit A